MRYLALLLALSLSGPAFAGVTVVWSPGVSNVDPYDPGYVPGPRTNYIWVAGGYDEFGNYLPGYWQPVADNPGFVWASGHWSGRVYHDGYWRPAAQTGYTWIDGYYTRDRYVSARWVRSSQEARVRSHDAAVRHAAPPSHRKSSKHK